MEPTQPAGTFPSPPEPPEPAEHAGQPPAYAADLERAERVLAGVERALRRLDDGSYGTCEVCGDAVDDGTLAESPTATTCRAHLPLAGQL